MRRLVALAFAVTTLGGLNVTQAAPAAAATTPRALCTMSLTGTAGGLPGGSGVCVRFDGLGVVPATIAGGAVAHGNTSTCPAFLLDIPALPATIHIRWAQSLVDNVATGHVSSPNPYVPLGSATFIGSHHCTGGGQSMNGVVVFETVLRPAVGA